MYCVYSWSAVFMCATMCFSFIFRSDQNIGTGIKAAYLQWTLVWNRIRDCFLRVAMDTRCSFFFLIEFYYSASCPGYIISHKKMNYRFQRCYIKKEKAVDVIVSCSSNESTVPCVFLRLLVLVWSPPISLSAL